MKKVLVYLKESELAPVGGPLGYNFNLKKGLEETEGHGFLIEYLPGNATTTKVNRHVGNIKIKWIKRLVVLVKSVWVKGRILYGRRHAASVDLSLYDAVHFHTTLDMFRVRDSLKEYKGRVLLTSHTPTKPTKEIVDGLTEFERNYMRWFYKKLNQVDEYAFTRATDLVFPCEEAEEPYYHQWPEYEELHQKNKHKYFYMTTGTSEKKALLDREGVRLNYGIPKEAFVISYVGRHNEIKGYGDLKKAGSQILQNTDDIYFLIAGQEEPLTGLNHPRWIEIGWTKDPGSLIQASDMFVLPNLETYFDLVMLEVLSLGQIILASQTGGNKYFQRFHNSGIYLYHGIEEAIDCIYDVKSLSKSELDGLRMANRRIYQENFTNKRFAENYCEVLNQVLK